MLGFFFLSKKQHFYSYQVGIQYMPYQHSYTSLGNIIETLSKIASVFKIRASMQFWYNAFY